MAYHLQPWLQIYPINHQTSFMKYIIILLAIPFLSASECSPKKGTPACVQNIIDEGLKHTPPDGPTQVDEYEYQGKRVFLFTMPCCDQYNSLYDLNCNVICAPSGGITGKGDGKCPDFQTNAKHIAVIWKKSDK